MAERFVWKFSYPVSLLVAPCKAKSVHHQDRAKHWEGELEKAEMDLRENGVTIEQFPTHMISGSLPGIGQNFVPKFDQRKVDRINECKGKIKEHRDAVQTFGGWARAFEIALRIKEDTMMDLDEEDVKLFGL